MRKVEKKQELIYKIQKSWLEMGKKRINQIAKEFNISQPATKKYINMTEDEIKNLDKPSNYKKRKTIMDDYLNIIYKMLRDGINDDIIYYYIHHKGYNGNLNSLRKYIYLIGKNNFSNRKSRYFYPMKSVYTEDIIVIKRNNQLKYLLTINPKIEKDKII